MSSFHRVFRSGRLASRTFGSSAAPQPAAAASSFTNTLDAVTHLPATQVTTLANGLRVASQRVPSQTATVGVWIDSGSRYESEDSNGVAHFLEHMFFKGTSRRSQLQLETEVENMGGHLNAYTSRESTVFYLKSLKKDMNQALDIIADMTQNSVISNESIERERSVIIRELEGVQELPEEVVFDDLHTTAFQGTPLGRTILGSPDQVRSITRDQILRYVRTHYTAPRMVVAGAGDFDHAEFVKQVEKLFGNVPSAPAAGVEVVKAPALFTGSDIRARYDDYPLAHVVYAFQTGGWSDVDTYPLLVMQNILGSWNCNVAGGAFSSSSLVSQLASSNLARSVSAFNTQYSDVGLFGVHVVAEDKALERVFATVPYEITRLGYDIGQLEVEEAKEHLKMNLLSMLDNPASICEDVGRQVLTYGRRMHPLEMIARVDAVDVGAVKRAAQRFLIDRDFALAAVGPIFELPDYVTLRRRTYRLV